MRVSALVGDIGYTQDRRGLTALLDGKLVKDCVVADEEKGYVITHIRDGNGNLLGDGQQLSEITRHGKVIIRYGAGGACDASAGSAQPFWKNPA